MSGFPAGLGKGVVRPSAESESTRLGRFWKTILWWTYLCCLSSQWLPNCELSQLSTFNKINIWWLGFSGETRCLESTMGPIIWTIRSPGAHIYRSGVQPMISLQHFIHCFLLHMIDSVLMICFFTHQIKIYPLEGCYKSDVAVTSMVNSSGWEVITRFEFLKKNKGK